MINFMLNDLRRPASVGLDTSLQFQGLILDLYGFIAFARERAAKKRQTAFLGIVCSVLFDNLGVKHYRVCWGSSTLVEERDNTFLDADHIRCHTNTTIFVSNKCIQQILCHMQIFFCRQFRLF